MVNLVILTGRLGKDPEVKTIGTNNVKVAKFTLATSKSYKDNSGNKQTKTEWHNIVVWRGVAEFAEKYIKKGYLVNVIGELKYNEYEKDGVKKTFTEIDCNSLQNLEPRRDNNSESTNTAQASDSQAAGGQWYEDKYPAAALPEQGVDVPSGDPHDELPF